MPDTTHPTDRIAALLTEATPDAAANLRALADTAEDKETRKAARRALYLLSQKGIAPPKQEPAAPVTGRPLLRTEALQAWASAFDGAGNRLLFFALPDPDGGSPTLLQILVNDEEGVREVGGQRMPRREVAEIVGRFAEQLEQGLALAEIEGDYGRWLLARVRIINHRLGRPTPRGFLDWLPRIGEPQNDYPVAPVLAQLSADEIRVDPTIAHDPADLFALPWFEPWFFAAQDALPWIEPWEKAESSVVVTSEPVVRERRERIVDEATKALMTPDMRTRYVQRLEESADVLRRRDETTAARQALYHAIALADNRPVEQSPFARSLVQRTIEAALAMIHAAEEKQRGQEQGDES